MPDQLEINIHVPRTSTFYIDGKPLHEYDYTETWISPTGQEFIGTPEYIVGVKAGFDCGYCYAEEIQWKRRLAKLARQCGQRAQANTHARRASSILDGETTTRKDGDVW